MNIHTICRSCLEEGESLSREDQEYIIMKKYGQWLFQRKKVKWMKEEWHFWLSCDECQRVNDSRQEDDAVDVHMFGNTSLT